MRHFYSTKMWINLQLLIFRAHLWIQCLKCTPRFIESLWEFARVNFVYNENNSCFFFFTITGDHIWVSSIEPDCVLTAAQRDGCKACIKKIINNDPPLRSLLLIVTESLQQIVFTSLFNYWGHTSSWVEHWRI